MILWWSSRISDKQLFFQDHTRKMEHIYILKLYNNTVASEKKIAIKYTFVRPNTSSIIQYHTKFVNCVSSFSNDSSRVRGQ
jgi:hypothetical protein